MPVKTKRGSKSDVVGKVERILFVPDCHHPNVDVRAWALMLRAGLAFKPDTIVVLGDFIDNDSLSMHAPSSVKHGTLKYEIEMTVLALEELKRLGAERHIYLAGNHEWRLERYVAQRAPAFDNIISMRDLLELDEGGWEWHRYGATCKLGKLNLTHCVGGKAGANAHRSAAVSHMGSTIIGHTHRMAYDVRGQFNGHAYLAAMFGWLGDFDSAAEYMHDAASRSEWVHGFGLGYMLANGIVHVQPVPIIDGACLVDGRIVT